ncbi:hypothetical protein ECDEC9A_3211 [Escherichia coli DEC9A]|nr:hypothetical protein ECDEC9A_3211 [Escherichia coli DEC9A]
MNTHSDQKFLVWNKTIVFMRIIEYLSGEDFFTGQAWCGLAEDW